MKAFETSVIITSSTLTYVNVKCQYESV